MDHSAYFTIALTLYNEETDVLYGVTSGHNLCNTIPAALYTVTMNQTLIADCATFI